MDVLDLTIHLGAYKRFLICIERRVHECVFWCSIYGVLTPPDRIRLKNDDMLKGGSRALLGG